MRTGGEFDDDGVRVGQRVPYSGGRARREIALQHDTLQAGTDGLARRIGGVRAGLEDRQRDDAARGRTGYEFRRVGTEQQAIDGRAGKQVERLGIRAVPPCGHPAGRRRNGSQQRHPGEEPTHRATRSIILQLYPGVVAKTQGRGPARPATAA
jgi:hypothetical protein